MSELQFFVGGVLPYLTIIVFVPAMAYRFYVWFRTPQPGKMTLTPAPKGSTTSAVLTETLFFPSMFKGDRILWCFSWFFHAALALIAIGHIRVVTGLIDQGLIAMGLSAEGVSWMSSTFGGAAGIVILLAVVLLLVRRLGVARVREISGVGDFFALILLLAIILTGNVMRFGPEHFDLQQTRVWAYSLLTFSPVLPESRAFLTHALLGQLLFIYIPFSKILHFGGVFFAQALVKRS